MFKWLWLPRCNTFVGVGPISKGRPILRCRRWRWHTGACRD
jgi:hypothetical protein